MSISPRVVAIHQDEILTGEAVALDVQPLGFVLRACGTIIDVAASVIVLLAIWWGATEFLGRTVIDLSAIGPILVIGTIVTMWVVIPTAIETLTRGRSLGKLAVGGRIVRIDGGSAGFRHAFIRSLVGVLEIWMTLGGVAALVGMFTPRSQRLGDLLAGTYAERTRATKLPPEPDPLPAYLAEWARLVDAGRLPDRLARRAAQFVRGSRTLDPGARQRAAATIAEELRQYVSPVPDVDPESFVRGVVAVRRDREYAALVGQHTRVAGLVAGTQVAPRGFPIR